MRMPMFGDSRPIAPLIRKGMIEIRRTDVTPPDQPFVRVVRTEWRLTAAGRAARKAAPKAKEFRFAPSMEYD